MGVPKFFRYISERYPCLSELVKETQIPEFDNLYLDMNGIIHNCSHPDDTNVQFRITEEQIFIDIFHYIDTLFRMIQPKKLFFMAVDGVAPRAKMNQQRGRRFRSAKEAETQEAQARENGEKLPETSRFDSNCITPGTAFMVRLQNGLKHFVQSKISTNPLWRQCRVILSGHETPGEGEHKIMEYIRFLKASPGFNLNTRHCLYGLDADLVMLGLCSHELHFSLLREEVKFGSKAKKSTSVDSTRFFLLHLGLMREYLELEFIDVKDKLPFEYNMDSIVDDWILMCYLVGNDFIPNLPNFHINTNALPKLYEAYKKVLPQLDGYINEAGQLHLKRLEVFLAELGEIDREIFNKDGDSLKGHKMNNDETFGHFAAVDNDIDENANDDLRELAQNTLDMYLGDDDDENTEDKEFFLHKRDYYMNKMGYPEMTSEVLAEQAECYVRALQWTLFYYYRGVKSWGWYYPHHYAPYISDVRNFSHLKLEYEEGKPFLPFQQLLAVLPAASKAHLPEAYHGLMTCETSEVFDYYPVDFKTDLNGKKQEWEAVVLIPFIDENRLLTAMKGCEHMLTRDEVDRNQHGPMYQYDYSEKDQGPRMEAVIYGLAPAKNTFCKETQITRNELFVDDGQMVLGTSPGVLRDVYFGGFPTLKHLQYTGEVKSIRAQVFDTASRNVSMVIKLDKVESQLGLEALATAAKDLIGREVFVGWPHLGEAKVVSLSSSDYQYTESGSVMNDPRKFEKQVKNLTSHYTTRMGIDVGNVDILVCVNPLEERKYVFGEQGVMKLEKVWSPMSVQYALQTVLRDVKMHSTDVTEKTHVREVFAKDSKVFMIRTMYYGSSGVVIDPSLVETCGRIMVKMIVCPEPDFKLARELQKTVGERYVNAYDSASYLGIHPNVFSMITGTCLIVNGEKRFPLPDNTPKTNVGLQLKFPKYNEEKVGYSKRVEQKFLYSQKAIDLVEKYFQRWPEVFQAISRTSNDIYFESTLFPGQVGKLREVCAWLKQQDHISAERRTCGSVSLEEETLKEVKAAVLRLQTEPLKSIKIQVRPHFLYKPGLNEMKMAPDSSAVYKLFDRVIMAKESHPVPLGLKGTIVGIHDMVDPNPVRQENQRRVDKFFDILFDQPFDDGGSIEGVANKCMFKVSQLHLINITYGIATYAEKDAASMKLSASAAQKRNKITESNAANDQLWAMLKQSGSALGTGSAPAKVTQKAVQQQEQYQKINVEDMFKVATTNLPKPPENWRNKMEAPVVMAAACSSELPKPPGNWRQKQQQSTDIIHPTPKNVCAADSNQQPMERWTNKEPRSTYFPQNSQASYNRPQGPQNLSRNGKYPPGQGAFIPLQATRSLAKGSQLTHKQQQDNLRREERKATRAKPSPSTLQQTDDEVVYGSDRPRPPFVAPNPPKSRIAARFEMPPF